MVVAGGLIPAIDCHVTVCNVAKPSTDHAATKALLATWLQTMPDAGLVDDDFGMELLVDGRIISLSLPVRAVFEGVWLPAVRARGADRRDAAQLPAASSASPGGRDQVEVIGPPMPVTYRLQVCFKQYHCVDERSVQLALMCLHTQITHVWSRGLLRAAQCGGNNLRF